jgi:hypothetical protein
MGLSGARRPSSICTMQSAISRMRLSWVTSKIAHPCSLAKRCIISTMSRPDLLFKAAVGSSARMSLGWLPRARAIATLFQGLIGILCIEPLKRLKYVLQNSIYTKN